MTLRDDFSDLWHLLIERGVLIDGEGDTFDVDLIKLKEFEKGLSASQQEIVRCIVRSIIDKQGEAS